MYLLSTMEKFPLKGTVSRDFLLHESSSPKPLKITWGSFQIFPKIRGDIHETRCTIVQCTSSINVHGGTFWHWYHWRHWHHWQIFHRCQQIIGTIADCLHLKVNLKEKISLFVNTFTQRCPNKIIKTFLIDLRISLRIMGLGPWGADSWKKAEVENFVLDSL